MSRPWDEKKSEYLVGMLHDCGLYEAFTECYSTCSLHQTPRAERVIDDVVRMVCDRREIKGEGARNLIKVGCMYL